MVTNKILLFSFMIISACCINEDISMEENNVYSIDNEEMTLEKYINKNVKFEGLAFNAKLGAIVDRAGVIIYVEGLKVWQDKFNGKKVEVTGLLVKGSNYKTENETGAFRTGIEGDYYIIQEAQWRLSQE